MRFAASIWRLRAGRALVLGVLAGLFAPVLWTGAVVIRKAALNQIGGFPLGITSGEDLLTWARLYAQFDIAYDPSPKSIYCKKSLSWRHDKRVPEPKDSVAIGLRELLTEPTIPIQKKDGLRKYIALWKKIRASHWIAHGLRWSALKTIVQSLCYNPLNLKVWMYIPYTLMPAAWQNKLINTFEKNVDQETSRI